MKHFLALLTLLPLLCGAAVHRIDCAEPQWRQLGSVNAIPLAPDDQLLLKAGCTWDGTLQPQGSGTPGHPIRLVQYGEGAKPLIRAQGGEAALLLRNQQYWEIENIAVSNDAAEPGLRRGVLVVVETDATLTHIYLRGLDVSHVRGRLGADLESKATGGIGFEVRGAHRGRFSDLLIENCTIAHVDNVGIYFSAPSESHPRAPNWEQLRWTKVRVRRNHLTDIGKNAMILRSLDAGVVEENTIDGAAARLHGNAIVIFACKDAIVQLNDVAHTSYSGLEGAAYDSDYNSVGTVIQYNHSRENGGGLVDLCNNPASKAPGGYNDGTVVRYNISTDERERVFGFDGPVTNTRIYNNTVTIGRGLSPRIVDFDLFGKSPGYARGVWFTNNIIVNGGSGNYAFAEGTDFHFDSNCFFGAHPASEPSDANKFIAEPSEGGSSCPAAGALITHNGGRDIQGTPLPARAPDRGAVQAKHYRIVEAVEYARPDGIPLVADIYQPDDQATARPAAIFIHGGGWSSGDRKQLARQAAYLAQRGVVGMAIEYRLAGQAKYPAALEDAQTAVKWLIANSGRYHVDTSKIAAIGSSAGGHLAALLGVLPGRTIAAAVVFNPVLDLAGVPGKDMVARFLGKPCEAMLETCHEASPLWRLGSSASPFLILHGTADETVPYSQAVQMKEKLSALGVRAELFTAEGGPHTFWASAQWFDPSAEAMYGFLKSVW
ncbi:MAG: alpha/beta hydrolase fold domain-containing protein [Ignavibacteriota bacterium]